MNNYEDIINCERYEVSRPRMSLYNRAFQFAPFSALAGYDECINEANRLTCDPIILDDDALEFLDKKIQLIDEYLEENQVLMFTYFVKDGGVYETKMCNIKRLDKVNGVIYFDDGTKVDIKDVVNIDGCLFDLLD